MHSFPARALFLVFRGNELVLIRSADDPSLFDVPSIIIEESTPPCAVVERGLKATSFRDISISEIKIVNDPEHVIFICLVNGRPVGLSGLGSTYGVTKNNWNFRPPITDRASMILESHVRSRLF